MMQYIEQKLNPHQDTVLTGAPATSISDSVSKIGAGIVSTVLADYRGGIAVRLWDGTLAQGAFDASCTVIFREPGALRDLILHPDLLRLADAYLAGLINVEGDLESLFDFNKYLNNLDLSLGTRWRLLYRALRLPKRTCGSFTQNGRTSQASHRNSLASIAHHYDVGNDFYRLWLDPQMVYSCAYYRNSTQSLADAQQDKLDYLCRKLRLQPG